MGDEFKTAGHTPFFWVGARILGVTVAARFIEERLVKAEEARGDAVDKLNHFRAFFDVVVAFFSGAKAFEDGGVGRAVFVGQRELIFRNGAFFDAAANAVLQLCDGGVAIKEAGDIVELVERFADLGFQVFHIFVGVEVGGKAAV